MEYEEFEIYWKRKKEGFFKKYGTNICGAYKPMRGPAWQVYNIEPEYTSIMTYRTMEEADAAAKQHAEEEGLLYSDLYGMLYKHVDGKWVKYK